MVGAAVGAAIGGLAGKAIGEIFDPTVEHDYWHSSYDKEPYYQKGMTYDDYAPAYRTGYDGREKYVGRHFNEVERDLEANYNRAKGSAKLAWENAKSATRAAWDRLETAVPGDADRDGK